MADVQAGQVRRPPPRRLSLSFWAYHLLPFEVLRVADMDEWWVRYVDENHERKIHTDSIVRCPLWPSEHEQWKDAKGYEVNHG